MNKWGRQRVESLREPGPPHCRTGGGSRHSAGTLFLGLLLGALVPVEGRAQAFPPDDSVRAVLEGRVALGRNPGIVVGLLDERGGRVVAAGSSGRVDVELDGNTLFEIGSVTKVFTAALLQDMADRGVLRFGLVFLQRGARHGSDRCGRGVKV